MEYKIGFLILIAVAIAIPALTVWMLKRILFGCPDCTWKGYWHYHSRIPEEGRRSCGRCGREEVEDMLGWSPTNQSGNKVRVLNSWFTPILGHRAGNRWGALALDFDLVSYGDTPEDAVAALLKVVEMHIKEAQEKNDPSILGVPSAQKCFDLFREVSLGLMLNEFFNNKDHTKEGHFCVTAYADDLSLKVRK